MTRTEIRKTLVDELSRVQELSGREVPAIVGSTKPIGGISGFDSLNDWEVTVILAGVFGLGEKVRLCVSDDGKRTLTIDEIVEKVCRIQQEKGETTDV